VRYTQGQRVEVRFEKRWYTGTVVLDDGYCVFVDIDEVKGTRVSGQRIEFDYENVRTMSREHADID